MSCDRPLLIVIAGPTGSGKTDLAIELAQHYRAPIISTDSRQVFKGMAVGTAQPDSVQQAAVRHYFIADRLPDEEYNCGIFEKQAVELLDRLFANNRYVVAVGGSGLYIDALCHGIDDLPVADKSIRDHLQQNLAEEGLAAMVDKLEKLDADYCATVDRNNPARVLRALEVCMASGRPYSAQRSGKRAVRRFDYVKIGISTDRAELYERINRRTDIMIAEGLEREAWLLYPKRQLNSLQTVGYRELFDYFDHKISLDQAVELIKRNTRRYAKRQMTWFRRDSEIEWFEKNDIAGIENLIENFGR